jgi:putative hydrolase of the HAD superfamily
MVIEAILFDFDDTLVVEEASAEEAFLAACEPARDEYGIDAVDLCKAVRENARRIWQAAPTIPYCRRIGISSWEGLWARFLGNEPDLEALRKWAPTYRREAWSSGLANFGVDDPAFAEKLANLFPQERRLRHIMFPETESVLKNVAGAYRLGIITNGASDLQREKIEGSGLDGYFSSITISGNVGVGKPDLKIFQAALDGLEVQAENVIMVGNSLKRDIAGAQQAGIKAIWVNRSGAPCHKDVKPDAEVSTLSALPDLLDEFEQPEDR